MLATEPLFVYVYCLVDDAIKGGILVIPRRPGPAPACTDAELLTIALVRHLLGRRSENGLPTPANDSTARSGSAPTAPAS